MSLPLPDSWVDCGSPKTLTLSGSLSVQMSSGIDAFIGSWVIRSYTPGGGPGGPPSWREEVTVENAFGVTEHVVQSDTTGPPAPIQMSTPLAYSETFGPIRLGMRYGLIDPGTANYPSFVKHYKVEYAWFIDRDTEWNSTLGADVQVTRWGGDGAWTAPQPGPTDFAPYLFSLPPLVFTAYGSHTVPGTVLVSFTDLILDGAPIDTSELDDGFLVGSGGGDVTATCPAASVGAPVAVYSVPPPWRFAYDLSVLKWGTADDLGAQLTDAFVTQVELDHLGNQTQPYADYLTTPIDPLIWNFLVWNLPWPTNVKSFGGSIEFLIQSAWAAAQDPPLPTDDLYLPLTVPLPTGGAAYAPVTVEIAPEVDVNRPDAAFPAPSEWVSSDADLIVVTEAATETELEVLDTGGTVTRTLFSEWRERVGLGSLGKTDPLFGVPLYENLTHYPDEDIWAWVVYAFLKLECEAPADGTLTMRVRGAWIDVYDPHTTSQREEDYTVEEIPYDVSYSVPLTTGSNTVWVDLLFPAEGGPHYHSRVDSVELSGFEVGTYTLTKLALAWRGTVSAYLKHGWGKQVVRNDYSAGHLSLDGSFPMGNFGERAAPATKDDEIGEYGGGLRYVNILTGYPSGTIQDAQMSLESYFNQWNHFEGISESYDLAASDAALSDAFDVKLQSEWAHAADFVPDRAQVPGVAWQPVVSIWANKVELVQGMPSLTVTVRHPLWGALEALVVDAGGRAAGGETIEAKRTDTGATVASGTTDDLGFVVVQPVPANGPGGAAKSYRLEAA